MARTSDTAQPLNADKESASSNIQVLVVDDETTTRLLLRAVMQKEGFQVTEARNGIECLEIFQQHRPDIILMDAMMPEMDGFTCCAAVQEISGETHTPILMITSLEDQESVDRAFTVGATDYVTKPIHWALLRQRVRRLQDMIEREQAEKRIKAALKEKESLLKEIHHRVKNNLQIISSLLSLQSSSIEDPKVIDLLRESQNRVRLMAIIHEKLYQTDDLGKIDLGEYIRDLSAYLLRSYEIKSYESKTSAVRLDIEVDSIFLEIDTAVSCGLIINELVSNSFKYAFSGRQEQVIKIEAKMTSQNQFSLSYADNGVGLPKELDITNTKTLGLQLITSLTDQLGGDLAVNRDNKTEFKFTNLLLSK